MITRRRKAREVVLKALYQVEFIQNNPTVVVEELIIQDYFLPAAKDFLKEAINKVESLSGQTQLTSKLIELVCCLPTSTFASKNALQESLSKLVKEVFGEYCVNILSDFQLDYLSERISNKYNEIIPILDFAKELVTKTTESINIIDNIISDVLENWQIDRLSLVDRAIIRFAICELQNFQTIPVAVTINEAIEIAKKYSTEKSSEFIHGILNGVVKKYKIIKESSSQK